MTIADGGLIAALRRGDRAALEIVRAVWEERKAWKAEGGVPASDVPAPSDDTTAHVSISQLFGGIKPTIKNVGEMSHLERCNRVADILEGWRVRRG